MNLINLNKFILISYFFQFIFLFLIFKFLKNLKIQYFIFSSILIAFLNLIISIFNLFQSLFNSLINIFPLFFFKFDWLNLGCFNIIWVFNLDNLSLIMIFIVNFISFLVQFYSLEYMRYDLNLIKFFAYLNLFAFFMLFLIMSNNYFQLFIGWEGVGLVSFLLIGFWDTRIYAAKAAFKAILINRIGDIFLLIGIILILQLIGSLDYLIIFNFFNNFNYYFENFLFLSFSLNINLILNLICICLFIGSIAKSAQLGLHTWLPDAMEGPTPVSALIHAATMVTAGIFLLIRSSFILEKLSFILNIIILFGGLTAFFGSTVAFFQNDIKKIIAYSTCSQLGYMMVACGSSNYLSSLFHLLNHAFFKALLFLGAGIIIHSLFNEQDMRKMGNLKKFLPLNYIIMLIGFLSLLGIPFLSGFFSKDNIIETIGSSNLIFINFIYWLILSSTFFTAAYSIKFINYVYFNNYKNSFKLINLINENSIIFNLILIILMLISIYSGFFFFKIFLFPNNFLFSIINLNNLKFWIILDSQFELYNSKKNFLLPLIFTFLGLCWGLIFIKIINYNYIYFKIKNFNQNLILIIFNFFCKKWYFDLIFIRLFILNLIYLNYNLILRGIEQNLIQWFGIRLINLILNKLNLINLIKINNGLIYNYLFFFIIGLIFLILIIIN
jgi:proton-translocating NADH-quinone oxidoreductase chain L